MNQKTSAGGLVVSLVAKTGNTLHAGYMAGNRLRMGSTDTGSHYPFAWNDRRVETLVIDPASGALESLDLCPLGDSVLRKKQALFVASSIGDIDGDGDDEIVCGVSLASADDPKEGGEAYILGFKRETDGWKPFPVAAFPDDSGISLLRSVAVGDVDDDGRAEIVVGTRPNGHVLLLKMDGQRFVRTDLEELAFGPAETNVREVKIGQLGGMTSPAIFAAIARTNAVKWGATPGVITMYALRDGTWQRSVVDEFDGGATHSRMIQVGAFGRRQENVLVANTVGVYDEASDRIVTPSRMVAYRFSKGTFHREQLCTLPTAIKSRGFDVGDIEGDGIQELVVGTRNIDSCQEPTVLSCYKKQAEALSCHQIAQSDRPMGFHCVRVVDVDQDGQAEIIASDDGNGSIYQFKRSATGWDRRALYQGNYAVFVVSIDYVKGQGCIL